MLEVGAGTGRDGIELARALARVVALDYSPESLRLIKGQLAPGDSVAVCCGDAFALPFADGSFDVVFHQGLLEHFRNPGDLIAENARVLRRGGYLLVDVPQRFHYYTALKHLLMAVGLWFAGWEREYSIAELEGLLRKHSFSIVSSYGEWFNPPMWYRMLRRGLMPVRIKLPLYPRAFALLDGAFGGLRRRLLERRAALYTTVVIGAIARKE